MLPLISTTDLENTIALLTRTPAALNALLRGLPDHWTRSDEGGETWNVVGVVAHLAYGERTDWMPRIKRLLEFGETVPFEPFDRRGHERDAREKSLPELLDDFTRLREASLTELRSLRLQNADFSRTGTHPAFGRVTLSQLLSTWAVHDLTHLHQITRVMAHQFREVVGPWEEYLGVLRCTGHGD